MSNVGLLNDALQFRRLEADGLHFADVHEVDGATVADAVHFTDLRGIVRWNPTDGKCDAITGFQSHLSILSLNRRGHEHDPGNDGEQMTRELHGMCFQVQSGTMI